MEAMKVNDVEYRSIKLLGKGKGGYSYLASNGGKEYVLKQIHHEPCSYYQFGNKLESEIRDYTRLWQIGIRMPKLLAYDTERECLLKEYIQGNTIYELVKEDRMQNSYLEQVKQMCLKLYPAHTNIDCFPTNFVVREEIVYYIDYECNAYMEEWNFENWGIKYWSRTEEFLSYEREHTIVNETE